MSSYVHLYVTAALAFAATALAVSNLQAPSSPAANSNVTITWSSDSSDTTPMTLSVFSADADKTFNGGLAIANNVNPQDNQITLVFPQVVSPGTYTLSLISASDDTNVLASSSAFTVGPAAVSASSTASRSSTATATAPPSSVSASLSSASASLSSVGASISSAASSAASSARSVASSALSSIASGASAALSSASASVASSSASQSQSSTGGAARALTSGPGTSLALAVVLGGFAAGALVL